jgi:hypothetical protein
LAVPDALDKPSHDNATFHTVLQNLSKARALQEIKGALE